jgi:SH3-like domain-containing protein
VKRPANAVIVVIALLVVGAACGFSVVVPTPTVVPATPVATNTAIATVEAATVASTAAIEEPTVEPEPTLTPTLTATPLPTLTPTPVPTPAAGEVPRARVVNTDGQGANLRREPSSSAQRIAVIREGSTVEIIGPDQVAEGTRWRNVRGQAGEAGWVLAELLEESVPAVPRPAAPPTIQIADVQSPITRGGEARLAIVTRPGARCEARFAGFGTSTYRFEGLEPREANGRGECVWVWKVPAEVVPGTWLYVIHATTEGGRATREVRVVVT